MAMPIISLTNFVDGICASRLLDAAQRDEVRRLKKSAKDARELAHELLRRDWLTTYQINQIFRGQGAGLTLGPFILLNRIGEGGMGQIYKAKQKLLQRIVALKVIRKECLDNPKVILRFQREIRAAGQLSHPHVVRALDADQINGTWYFAMEYIDGRDLAQLVKEKGPLPVAQACEYIRQAALGLQHAFERGLVHRDIKPANLLVTKAVSSARHRVRGRVPPQPRDRNAKQSSGALSRVEGQHYPWGMVKILDMGLARRAGPITGPFTLNLTMIGSVIGTPDFIAPEQARDSHSSDIRADLYSLGCTLYFLLAGQPPFPHGMPTDKLLQHQFNQPQSVVAARRDRLLKLKKAQNSSPGTLDIDSRIPPAVVRLLQRMMAKKPVDRHQTPLELANELQVILKKMSNGTLPMDEAADDSTVELPVLTDADAAGAPTKVAVVKVAKRPMRRQERARVVPLVLASLGACVALLIGSMIAVILSRGG